MPYGFRLESKAGRFGVDTHFFVNFESQSRSSSYGSVPQVITCPQICVEILFTFVGMARSAQYLYIDF